MGKGNRARTFRKKQKVIKTKQDKKTSNESKNLVCNIAEYERDLRKRLQDRLAKRRPQQASLTSSSRIRVGHDCAGMGGDMVALHLLGLLDRCDTVFWSEIDDSKAALYKKVCSLLGIPDCEVPARQKDLTTRNHESDAGSVDMYLAGFPCPSYSGLGKRLGAKDPRGAVVFHCLRYCIHHCPAICILENVQGILEKKHRPVLKLIAEIFKALNYRFYLRKLNTRDFGIPQSRPRVYMVALRKEAIVKDFRWPKPWKHSKKRLSSFIDVKDKGTDILDIHHYEEKIGKEAVWKQPFILDVASSEGFQSAKVGMCPCLTKSRLAAKGTGFYIPVLKRRLSLVEAGKLQGLPSSLVSDLLRTQTERSVGAAIGDGMSMNVLCKVLLAALTATGLVESHFAQAADPWKAP